MKIIVSAVITALLSVNCFSGLAQFKQIAESPVFEDPATGYAKILQMKNGNTAYIHITPREGIELRIYDANHAEKAVTEVDLSIDRVKMSNEMTMFPTNNREEIEGVFEIAGDIVVFFHEFTVKKSALYRVIIDGNTAKLKEEKEIFSEQWANYTIKKDMYSDNYAILTGEKIIHYNAEHKEVNTAEFKSPDAANPTLYYRDMIVLGGDRVCLFYLASDKSDKAKDNKGNMYIVTTERVSAKISYDKLDLPADQHYDYVMVKYDATDKKIILLTVAKANNGTYETYLNLIDPVSKKIEKIAGFGPTESLNQAYAERYSKKTGYGGLPQNLFVNADGTISVVYEEMGVQTTTADRYSRTDTKLGKLVINTFDKKGKLISNYLVPKAHWIIFTALGVFYHYQQEDAVQKMWRGNQYKPFQYIDGPKGKFIFFNDTERNNDVTKDKFAEVQAVADCDAFMYKLSGTEVFSKREYAFGEPEKKGHTIAMFSVSAYDKKTNTYVTLKLDDTRKKKIKMVWLQPE
jgi:hypothetical protein